MAILVNHYLTRVNIMINEKKQVIGYIRVSTQDQKENGVSLPDQRERIEGWCQSQGHELLKIYEENKSGSSIKNRTAFKEAIEATQKNMFFVVVKLDRFSRSLSDTVTTANKLKNKGATLVSISESFDTQSPIGKVVFAILASFAEFERDVIVKRTTDALRYKKLKGERMGTIPFGYSVDEDGKTLIQNEDEQHTILVIHTLRGQGYSMQKIANQLNKDGLLTSKGKQWKYQYINNVLKKTAAQ